MELARLAMVYVHLIACCVAIGLVLTNDISVIRQLLKADSSRGHDADHLDTLQQTVSAALTVLWVTGITLVALDTMTTGWGYLPNPKLQAKVLIVMLLTLNGLLLHSAVLPAMKKAGSLLHLCPSQRLLAIFAGSVSGVSWFYAAMLGVGRPLSWKYPMVTLLLVYARSDRRRHGDDAVLTLWSREYQPESPLGLQRIWPVKKLDSTVRKGNPGQRSRMGLLTYVRSLILLTGINLMYATRDDLACSGRARRTSSTCFNFPFYPFPASLRRLRFETRARCRGASEIQLLCRMCRG